MATVCSNVGTIPKAIAIVPTFRVRERGTEREKERERGREREEERYSYCRRLNDGSSII